MIEYSWIILSIVSAIFFGLKDILAKKFLEKTKINSRELIFHEYVLVFVFVCIVFYNQIDFMSIYSMWALYIFKAISVGMASYLYFKLLEKHEISLVSPLINLSPIFLLFLSSIFLLEKISLIQLSGIVIIIIATYFLEVTMHHYDKDSPHAHHFLNLTKKDYTFFTQVVILLSVFSFAAISDKLILGEVNVYTNMFFTSFFILYGLIFYYIRAKKLKQSLNIFNQSQTVLLISTLTIISNFLILLAIAIPTAMVSLIIPLRRTSTLFSSFFGGLLFHEKHLGKKLFAIFLMLLGVALIVYTGDITNLFD